MNHAARRQFVAETVVVSGVRYRSKMEARYAEYLAWLVKMKKVHAWGYETTTFWFTPGSDAATRQGLDGIRRGVTSYKPDFYVNYTDGRHEFHEVKGYMDPRSRVALTRMALYYPEETVVVIDKAYMSRLKRAVGGILRWT